MIMIQHREGEVILMVFAMDRLAFEIPERIVHPAHVPFEREAQPPQIGRTSHLRPGGRFLRNSHYTWKFGVSHMIEFAQELDGFEVLAPAILIRNPFARLARIVQVEHGGDRIDSQAVNMVAVTPEQRVSDQEIDYFVPAVIENECAPILMGSFARILMLVKSRSIEPRQRPVVPRKVCRDPIDNHADPSFMQCIHQELKVVGCSISTRRGEEACNLVTPGWIKGML